MDIYFLAVICSLKDSPMTISHGSNPMFQTGILQMHHWRSHHLKLMMLLHCIHFWITQLEPLHATQSSVKLVFNSGERNARQSCTASYGENVSELFHLHLELRKLIIQRHLIKMILPHFCLKM